MSITAPPTTTPVRRLGLIVAVLGGVAALAPAAMDLYMPGLPRVATDFHASTAAVALTMTTYFVGLGIGVLVYGSLSDSFGRRRPLLVGLALYIVAALGCAFAPSVAVLVVMRGLLGFSASGGHSVGNAIVADYARGARAARMLSRLALVSYLAPVLAPIIGAQMLRFTSWRGLFVAVAILGVVILVAAVLFVDESLPAQRRVPSGVTSTLKNAGRLLRDGHYVGVLLTNALTAAGFYAYLTGVSLVFQELGGLSATGFSVVFTINAAGMLVATQVNHRLLARFSPRQLLTAELLVAALGAGGAVAASFIHPLNVVALAAPLFVAVACVAAIAPNAVALALSLHPETAGSAAALFSAMGFVLGAMATPLVGVGGTSAFSMTLVMLVAAAGALAVYTLGPRRQLEPDAPAVATATAGAPQE